ncbi:MAG: YfhO family protein [Christensenellaceae bacterium]
MTIGDIGVFGVKKEKFSTAAAGVKTLGLTAGKNSLSGRYTASGGECVFLSVAYDEGLSAKINGKKAPLYEVYDGFTAFYLEEGENEVVISFRPKGFIAGTALCVVGLGLCVGRALYAKRKGGFFLPALRYRRYYAFIAVGGWLQRRYMSRPSSWYLIRGLKSVFKEKQMSEETEKTRQNRFWEIVRFLIVGGTATLVDYLISHLFISGFCRPPSSERPFPSYFPRRWASASGLPSTGFYPSDLCSET